MVLRFQQRSSFLRIANFSDAPKILKKVCKKKLVLLRSDKSIAISMPVPLSLFSAKQFFREGSDSKKLEKQLNVVFELFSAVFGSISKAKFLIVAIQSFCSFSSEWFSNALIMALRLS